MVKLETQISKYQNTTQWLVLIGIILGVYLEVIFVILTTFIIWHQRSKIFIPLKSFCFMAVIFMISVINISHNSYDYGKFIQQYTLLFIVIIGYSIFFSYNLYAIDSLFSKYLKIMYFICILGLIQFILCLLLQVDIFPFTLDGYIQKQPAHRIMRIHSILAEAGNLGTLLTPAVAVIFNKRNFFIENKKLSIVILITFFLTLATISLVALALIINYWLYNKFKFLKYAYLFIIISIIPFLFTTMKNIEVTGEMNNQNFFTIMQYKVVQSASALDSNEINDYESLNASSYAILANLWVAKNAPSRIIGTGLGTHPESYKRVYPETGHYLYGLNSQDGYSLLNRIFSEFGWIGLSIYVLFIIKNINTKNAINIACLFYIITILMRGGHYTMYGVIFFNFLFLLSSTKRTKNEKEQNSVINSIWSK